MKKFFLILLAVVVVAVGVIYIFKNQEQKEAEIAEQLKNIRLAFQLDQTGISIAVDDSTTVTYEGHTADFELPKGEHKFNFSKSGYEDLQKFLIAEKDTTFLISLKKIEVVKHVPKPGFVKISSLPEEVNIYINDQKKETTPSTIKLDAGNYTLKLEKKDYHEFTKKFTLKENQTIDLGTVELLPQFAYYSVNTIPEEASIFLDGVLVGSTKMEKTVLASGYHNLQIKKDMYYEYNEDFEVMDGEFKQFDIRLKATFGSLVINTESEDGAKVYIDEQLVGVTPYLNEMIMPGQYRIRVEKELCIGTEKILTIYEDERTEQTLIMTKNYTRVKVDAPGCEIFLDNEKVGDDYCELKLEKGQYQLKCTKENHHWIVETIEADPNNDLDLFMEPEPMMADLNVESKPVESVGAEIWVDEEKTDQTTPNLLALLPGEYDVSVKHKYFHEQTKHVSLNYDKPIDLKFKLKPLKGSPVARSINWKRSKWTSFTATMLLVGAGAYYNYQGDLSYDKYNDSTNTPDAVQYRKDTDDYLEKRDYAYTFSVVPAAWFFYSWLKQNHYNKKATE